MYITDSRGTFPKTRDPGANKKMRKIVKNLKNEKMI